MEAEVLPVEAQAITRLPNIRAAVTHAVIPKSLNEPVGLLPWCLMVSLTSPAQALASGTSSNGVLPSARVTIWFSSLTNGSNSRKRQTPLRSSILLLDFRCSHVARSFDAAEG